MPYAGGVTVSLPQLVDLALGSPETGAVDFHLLNALLHVMLQQMELTTAKAQFLEGDATRLQLLQRRGPPQLSLALEEYIMAKDKEAAAATAAAGAAGPMMGAFAGPGAGAGMVRVLREEVDTRETVVVVLPRLGAPPPEVGKADMMHVAEARLQALCERPPAGAAIAAAAAQLPAGAVAARRLGRGPTAGAGAVAVAAVTGPGGDIVHRSRGPSMTTAAPTVSGETMPGTVSYAGDYGAYAQPITPSESVQPVSPGAAGLPSAAGVGGAADVVGMAGVVALPGVPGSPGVVGAGPDVQPQPGDVVAVAGAYAAPPLDVGGPWAAPPVPGVPVVPFVPYLVPGEATVLGVPGTPPVPGRAFPASGRPPPEGAPLEAPAAGEPDAAPAPAPAHPHAHAPAPGRGRRAEDEESVGGLRPVGPPLAGGAGAVHMGRGPPVDMEAWEEAERRLSTLEHDVRGLWAALECAGPSTLQAALEDARDALGAVEGRLRAVEESLGADGEWRQELNALGSDVQRLKYAQHEANTPGAGAGDSARESGEAGFSLRPGLCACARDMRAVKHCLQVLAGGVAAWELWAAGGAPPDELQLQLADSARVRVLEARVDEVRDHVRTLQEQADDTERELGLLAERATSAAAGRGSGGGGAGGDTQGELAGLTELYNKIHLMQCDVEAISNACSKLMEERDRRSLQLVQLAAQLDALRTAKADREEVDEALQAKADQLAVNRKVSHEQLDTALEELARGLQEAVSKLAQQEQLWQQALEEMQTEIGSKLDSQELAPLKEFVNKKLRTLHERLKNLAKVRKQAEAAGTKRKLLRDATCVSCDAEVVMATEEEAAVPRPPPLPPPRSARPYLTYELDMIRRQQQQAGSAKNLLHLEAALVEDDRRAKTSPAHSHSHVGKGEHVCSRYCGGSHTVTTAFQRVVRKGHFALQEAGPECSQLLPERGPAKPNGKPHSAPQPQTQTQTQSQTQPKPEAGDAANKKK